MAEAKARRAPQLGHRQGIGGVAKVMPGKAALRQLT
jgi:hypothetical protein